MKLALFGATGDLGQALLTQSLEAGHEVTVLVRSPGKLSEDQRKSVTLVEGDGLVLEDVRRALPADIDAILFAVGVDEKTSPRDLCTDVTRNILTVMRERNLSRFIWCGGGSNLRPEDEVTLGARFVRWFSEWFLNHRHTDKEHQLALLDAATDIDWFGIRPLQMSAGPMRAQYRLGFDRFSGMSRISFADCAHAMLGMLEGDTWWHKAPIVQY